MGAQPPVLIGEMPGFDITSRPHLALTGPTGRRVAALAGVSWEEYCTTDRRNVFSAPVEHWLPAQARKSAEAMVLDDRIVVLFGDKVASAFGVKTWLNYEWHEFRGGFAARAPHPSGRNRVLNSTVERAVFGAFMRKVIRGE